MLSLYTVVKVFSATCSREIAQPKSVAPSILALDEFPFRREVKRVDLSSNGRVIELRRKVRYVRIIGVERESGSMTVCLRRSQLQFISAKKFSSALTTWICWIEQPLGMPVPSPPSNPKDGVNWGDKFPKCCFKSKAPSTRAVVAKTESRKKVKCIPRVNIDEITGDKRWSASKTNLIILILTMARLNASDTPAPIIRTTQDHGIWSCEACCNCRTTISFGLVSGHHPEFERASCPGKPYGWLEGIVRSSAVQII